MALAFPSRIAGQTVPVCSVGLAGRTAFPFHRRHVQGECCPFLSLQSPSSLAFCLRSPKSQPTVSSGHGGCPNAADAGPLLQELAAHSGPPETFARGEKEAEKPVREITNFG